MNRSARRRCAEDGAELVEFALVFPLLLMVVLAIVDFGFLFQRYEVLTNAAREGARIAVLPGYQAADVQARVLSYVQTGGLPTGAGNPAIQVNNVSIAAGATPMPGRQVIVQYTHTYLFLGVIAGWFGGSFGNVTLQASSTMRNEMVSGS